MDIAARLIGEVRKADGEIELSEDRNLIFKLHRTSEMQALKILFTEYKPEIILYLEKEQDTGKDIR